MMSSLSRFAKRSASGVSARGIPVRNSSRTYSTNVTKNNNNYPDVSSHPFRSILYTPAINMRALEKLETFSGKMKPDAVMFDLEDGVGPDRKEEARQNLIEFFKRQHSNESPYFGIVRINRVDTPWFEEDAEMALKLVQEEGININGIVLPKIECWKDVDLISKHFSDMMCSDGDASPDSPSAKMGRDETSRVMSPVPIWAMMETPRAILAASEIAGHPSIQGLILGTNDLCKELGLQPTSVASAGREGLITSLQMTILAARAHNKLVIDGVYNNFRDEEGYRKECLQGKSWGMDGKTLIHPSQTAATNEMLAPSAEEIEHAKRVVACWEESSTSECNKSGKLFTGVAVLDGMMLEQLHVDGAMRLLDLAEGIGLME